MAYSHEEFDQVLKMVRPAPLNEDELVSREFSDIKETLAELKILLKE